MDLAGNLHSPATAPTILLTPICSSLTVNLVSYMRYNGPGKELYRDAQYIFPSACPVAGGDLRIGGERRSIRQRKMARRNQLRGLAGARRKEGCREVERPGQENA